MLNVLRQRNICFLWTAGLISTLGDWVIATSLPFYVYLLTGSALATGTMFLIEAIPRIAFGYLAGIFVDRWNQKWIMILSDLSRAILLLLLFFVHNSHTIWIIYLVAFVETTISLLFTPAKGALLPELVEKQHLMQVNTLGSISDNFCRLAGPIIGGALLGLSGIYSVVVIDILSYLVSGILIFCIHEPASLQANNVHDTQKAVSSKISVWSQGVAGIRVLYQKRWLLMLSIVMGMGMFAQGIINVLLVVFVNQTLHSNALGFGWIMSAQGIGGLLGGFLIGLVGQKIFPSRLLASSLTSVGVLFLLIIHVPIYGFALALFALAGIPVVGWTVSASTLLQKNVDRAYRGRVLGIYGSIQMASLIIGMGAASIAGSVLGANIPLDIAAGMLLLSGLIAFLALKGDVSVVHPAPQKVLNVVEVSPK
ncbi:MAG: MFS transporter [Ktedonobacteraceae bacterium]|nr:MFS transporter [Ktedonobacteraceae bacterium]MBV9615354.1 MFS transporter [Ktedonobacteraceae bacterium]